MPNTLTHIAVQGFAAQGMRKSLDPKLVYIGLLIPDLPFILRRLVLFSYPEINEYDLALYSIIQSTLIFSLILSLALSLLTSEIRKTFVILSINAFAHLVIDATQIKWGNGVHLIAPLDWQPINFGFYWPESILIKISYLLGLAYIFMNWRKAVLTPIPFKMAFSMPKAIAALLLCFYLFIPPLIFNLPEESGSHFIQTLRNKEKRRGRAIEIDRASYRPEVLGGRIIVANEEIKVSNNAPANSGVISLKGTFTDTQTIEINEWHMHSNWLRDSSSHLALVLIASSWLVAIFVQFRRRESL